MNKRLLLIFALILLLASLWFMLSDFFDDEPLTTTNPYEYNIDNYKIVDSSVIAWKETMNIPVTGDTIRSLGVDQQDNIYVGTFHKLLIYSKEGHLKNSFDVGGKVYSLFVNRSGKIFLGMKDHIEIWNRSGRKLQSWDALNSKSIITSIHCSDELVYVADAGNRVVYQYKPEGMLQMRIGEKDSTKGSPGFVIPSPYFDLLQGRDDELWVVNPGRHQFEAYNEKGQMISSWKKTSMQLDGFSGCCNPTHMAMLSTGDFVTSEKGIERIKIHRPDGSFAEVVAPPEAFEEGTVGLDLAVDSEDRILVLDKFKGAVRIFERK